MGGKDGIPVDLVTMLTGIEYVPEFVHVEY